MGATTAQPSSANRPCSRPPRSRSDAVARRRRRRRRPRPAQRPAPRRGPVCRGLRLSARGVAGLNAAYKLQKAGPYGQGVRGRQSHRWPDVHGNRPARRRPHDRARRRVHRHRPHGDAGADDRIRPRAASIRWARAPRSSSPKPTSSTAATTRRRRPRARSRRWPGGFPTNYDSLAR